MYTRQTLPGPSTADPKTDRAQYEHDCLEGRRFPAVTDTAMQERCQKAWRLREWLQIFARHHLAALKDGANRASRFRNAWGELEDIAPDALTRRMIAPWFHQLGRTRGPLIANDILQELKLLYNTMIDLGWHEGHNPVVGIRKFPGRKPRQRYLQYEELPILLHSIDEEPLQFQAIFLLTLVCGCRPGEAIALRWENLKFWEETDAQGIQTWRGRWIKKTTKSGVGQIIPLPPEIIDRLRKLDRLSDEWVFPGDLTHCRRVAAGPVSYSKINVVWRRVCRRINIHDLWLYDLRRSCATIMMARGVNLGTISRGILNHASFQHTNVYCQVIPETVEHALRDHSQFVLGGGHVKVKPAPAQPSPASTQPIRTNIGQIDWPG